MKKPIKQHQDYDKIFKENLTKTGEILLTKVCGLSHLVLENADTTLPRTIERRVDFLKIGTNPQTGLRELYHLEFQSNVHKYMEERELLYYALLLEKHHLPIIQYVIYLGNGTWTAPTQINHKKLNFQYEVVCINTIDYNIFIQSDTPEEIILAILSDFKGENKQKVVEKIIRCLEHKTKNKRKLDKYILQLEILSNLRNLQPLITHQLSDMSIHYDVKTDLRYLQGKDEGIEQGIEQERKHSIINLLRSGLLSVQDIAYSMKVSIEYVQALKATIEP